MVALHPGTLSERKIEANRRNARRSTGPRTAAGRARASLNAVTHGAFCRDMVLPGESQSEFDALRDGVVADLRPRGMAEAVMVEQFIAAAWRIRRVRAAARPLCGEPGRGSRSAVALVAGGDAVYERLTKLEERLERTLHRCLRELRLLRKDAAELAEDDVEDEAAAEPAAAETNEQNEPTADDANERSSAASEAIVRNEPTRDGAKGAEASIPAPAARLEPRSEPPNGV